MNPGSWNRHGYALGDPVNFSDPRGLDACGPGWQTEVWLSGPSGDPCDPGMQSRLAPSPTPPDPACSGPDPGPPSDPDPAGCSISVAFSGSPRDGQNLVGLNNITPTTNTLGEYSNGTGWFFAVQTQANLSGDTNPLDWTPSQTVAISGSITVMLPGGSTRTVEFAPLIWPTLIV